MSFDPDKAADLRTICNLIGGQTKLARLIGMHPTLLRKKIAGKVPISRRDERAVDMALNELLRLARKNAGAV